MGGRGKKIDPNAAEKQKQLIEVFVPRLRQARRESGLMQKDIANALFTTEACVSRWMNGKALPEAVYIPALANVLNVSTDWLLGLDETDQKCVQEKLERLARLEIAFGIVKMAVEDVENERPLDCPSPVELAQIGTLVVDRVDGTKCDEN